MNSRCASRLIADIPISDATMGATIARAGMTDARSSAPIFSGDKTNAATDLSSARGSRPPRDTGLAVLRRRSAPATMRL